MCGIERTFPSHEVAYSPLVEFAFFVQLVYGSKGVCDGDRAVRAVEIP